MKFKRNTNKSAAIKNEMNDDEVQSDSSDGSMPKSELRAAQLLLSIQNNHQVGQQRKVSGGKHIILMTMNCIFCCHLRRVCKLESLSL
jgi:hypothetical protein